MRRQSPGSRIQSFGSVFIFSGSGSRCWGWRPIRIQGFNDQKLKKNYSWNKKLNFFWSKTAIYLSLGLHKVWPSCRRSLQLLKEAIQHFKTWTFTNFFLLLWFIFALLDPDPDPLALLNTDPIRIRIRNPARILSRMEVIDWIKIRIKNTFLNMRSSWVVDESSRVVDEM